MGESSQIEQHTAEQYSRLLAANQRRIYAYLLSLVHDPIVADDLMQEVAALLWRKFDQFKIGTSFGAWAVGVARLTVLEWRRKQEKLPLPLSDEELLALAEVAEELSGEYEERESALQRCLERMKPNYRHLLHLRYYVDLSVRDIAEAAGVSRRAIYKALERIHGNLLKCVRGQIISGQIHD